LKAELLRRYIFALNSLVKELMAQNKIDEAKAARDVGNAVGATLAALETSTSTVSTQGAESSRRPVPGFAREFRKHHYLLVKKATTTRVQRSAENKPTEAAFTWTKAQEACEKMGGHLVKVNDAEAFEFVRSLAEMEKGNRVWIGLRRLEDDGKFTWVDGSDVLYKGWGGWQPKKGPAMKFVSMGKGWEHKIGWDVGFDSDGDVTGYVCEWDY
jgi:hypothetical protein